MFQIPHVMFINSQPEDEVSETCFQDFDVLLTVHLSIFLAINQLNA